MRKKEGGEATEKEIERIKEREREKERGKE